MARHAWYNEIEFFAATWMRAAMDRNLIARGIVVEDDIRNLKLVADMGAVQFHAFAGIGIWSHALRLAGWPDDVPVWTGSCPCQPFSQAGRRQGVLDARHLWPDWFRQIRACNPPVIFGEQVASPDGLAWFDAVSSDLEGAGYAVEAFDLCAAGVGAPHLRQRLYFVALSDVQRCKRIGVQLLEGRSQQTVHEARRSGKACVMAERRAGVTSNDGDPPKSGRFRHASQLGNAGGKGSGWDSRTILEPKTEGDCVRLEARSIAHVPEFAGAAGGFWNGADFIGCRDGKWRPVEPGTFPLAHGARSRVGRLRAHGNAIVPQVAQVFIESVIDYLVSLAEKDS